MSAFSNYYENQIINHMLRGQAFTPPATVYLALFTAVTGLETDAPTAECKAPGADGYARQETALDAAVGDGVTANTADEIFGPASADWGTISHVALVDHATNVTWGTNVHVLMWAALTTPKAVGIGDSLKFAAGNADFTVA